MAAPDDSERHDATTSSEDTDMIDSSSEGYDIGDDDLSGICEESSAVDEYEDEQHAKDETKDDHIYSASSLANRIFDPSKYDHYRNDRQAVQISPKGPWVLLSCPWASACRRHIPEHFGGLFVSVNGSCEQEGTMDARAVSTVIFHPANKKYNHTLRMFGPEQRARRAGFTACLMAMKTANRIRKESIDLSVAELLGYDLEPETTLCHVVVKVSYGEAATAIAGIIDRWNTKVRISNEAEFIEEDEDLVQAIEKEIKLLNKNGVLVEFWCTPQDGTKTVRGFPGPLNQGVSAEQTTNKLTAELKRPVTSGDSPQHSPKDDHGEEDDSEDGYDGGSEGDPEDNRCRQQKDPTPKTTQGHLQVSESEQTSAHEELQGMQSGLQDVEDGSVGYCTHVADTELASLEPGMGFEGPAQSGEDVDMDQSSETSSESEQDEEEDGNEDDDVEEGDEEDEEDTSMVELMDSALDGSRCDGFATTASVCHQSAVGPYFEINSPEKCFCCGLRKSISGSVVISTDGLCMTNERGFAHASSAVYFHPLSAYNENPRLEGKLQNSQRAELYAALLALRQVRSITRFNRNLTDARGHFSIETCLRRVLIKTDYQPLVTATIRDIYIWKEKGFFRKKKKPVQDVDLYLAIDKEVEELNARGVRVQFWHVNRAENEMADYLAKARLQRNRNSRKTMEIWMDRNDEWTA